MDWVEKDFLDLDKWNVKQVTLDNYEVNLAKGSAEPPKPALRFGLRRFGMEALGLSHVG